MPAELKNTMTFSDEQALLLDTATEYFRANSSVAAVRDRMLSETGYETGMWQEMVNLGWTALAIPEESGGTGLGLGAAVCIAEPMGRHLCASPWLSTQLFVQGLLAGGNDDQKNAGLGAVVEGAAATVALFEAEGSWDLLKPQAQVTIDGDHARLNGLKTFVSDAAVAHWLLISAVENGRPVLALVSREQLSSGRMTRETVIDETRRCYQLELDGITIPAAMLISGDAAIRALGAIEQAAWLLLAAEAAGGTAGVLDVIVEYLNTRTAFGRRIGSYQGLKHPTVDILIGLERSRSHVYHAASLCDAGEDAKVASRMAKAQASDNFAFAGDRAIQFHGGFGFTWECDAQLFLRRALFCQYSFGDAPHHRKRLANLLLQES
jgi:acyl-CoA dehydrogenase